MGNDLNKQIFTNKKLKKYFSDHQEEKKILGESVESDYKFRFLNQIWALYQNITCQRTF